LRCLGALFAIILARLKVGIGHVGELPGKIPGYWVGRMEHWLSVNERRISIEKLVPSRILHVVAVLGCKPGL
jgi:hypothetical protein